MIVVILIFLNSRSYTGFEFGILVIGIFAIWDLLFPGYPGADYGKTEEYKKV